MTPLKPDQPKVEMKPERISYWQHAIKMARQKREEMADTYGWKDNLERYLPKPAKKRGRKVAEVSVGADFSDVERKKAALLFDQPMVALTPDLVSDVPAQQPAAPGQPAPPSFDQGVALHQELLNGILGPLHANAQPTALKAIFDCLCPSGVGPAVIGYHCTKQKIKTPEIKDGFGAVVQEAQDLEFPIHERFFVSRFSPMALLLPAEHRDTDFQRAPWLGFEWQKPVSQVRREFSLAKDWMPSQAGESDKKLHFETEHEDHHSEGDGDPMVSGATIWYRAELDSDGETTLHPEMFKELVFVNGMEQPVVWKDSEHQTLDQEGRLTPDSLIGNPIRPLVLRDVSDSAWVPSDVAVTGPLTKELNKFRSQLVTQRDGNKQVIAYDSEKFNPTAKDKVTQANGITFVALEAGALAGGMNTVMDQVGQASLGREHWEAQNVIQRDREQILGIGANQVGAQAQTRRTASEVNTVQRNTEARFEQERNRVLAWYLHIVRGVDALVLRYCDARLAAEILGQQKAQTWFALKDSLKGGYRYEIQMDSGKYLDATADRRDVMQNYNLLAKDPLVNRKFLLEQVAKKHGWDPTAFIAQPEPPKPEPPKVSLTVKGEDLNPMSMQYSNMVLMLQAAGIQAQFAPAQALDPLQQVAITQRQAGGVVSSNPQHGGAADKAERIDQHNLDQTGQISGPKGDA